MPSGDGTGPMGLGPMTGKKAGYCAGFGMPGFMNPVPGRGFGGGGGFGRRGGGRGWRHCYHATGLPGWARAGRGTPSAAPFAPQMTQEQEAEVLKGQAQYFEKALENIKKRIEDLAAGKKQE